MNRCLYCLYCIVVFMGFLPVASGQIISGFAGNGTVGYSGDGGAAASARLDSPTSIATDRYGNIYINDQFNYAVRKVSTSGIITTIAGTGSFGFSGDNGPATAARLNGNWGIATDTAGNVYITDQFNYRVRKVNAATGVITTIAGTGAAGYTGDGSSATAATFNKPLGIATDEAGNIFVGDIDNYCVRKISPEGSITTYAGTGIAGFSGDGGPATAARFGYIFGLATGKDGSLYICDGGNYCVRKVSPDGIVTTVAGNGSPGFSGDGGPAVSAAFNFPVSVSVSPGGAIVIVDGKNNRLRRVGTDGIVKTIVGTGVPSYNGEGIPATSAHIFHPAGVLVDTAENVYFSDMRNVRVRKVVNVLYFLEGDSAHIAVCENGPPVSVDTILSVRNVYTGYTDTWSLEVSPVHGTAFVSYSATSTGGITVPSGLTYQPAPGYTGLDSFDVKVANSLTSDIIRVYVSVDPLLSPGIITGPGRVCVHDTIELSNTVTGGLWATSSGHLNFTTIGLSCKVWGLSAGVDTVKYLVANACGIASARHVVTVDPLPSPGNITGPAAFCLGNMVNFTATATGGVWTTSNSNTSVNAVGQVKGIAPGTSVVIYTVYNNWCHAAAVQEVLVDTFPDAGTITGPVSLCVGASISLSSEVDGGLWTTSLGFATVANGVVTGVTPGNEFVNYSITNTCGTDIANWPVAVYPLPVAPEITVVQGVLYADKGYATYQWRLNAATIPGAVADTLYATEMGLYEVEVSNAEGCTVVSATTNYTGCGADELQIMPNPVSGDLSIVWCRKITATLYTADGRLAGRADEVRRISLKDLPAGIYFLNVFDPGGIRVKSLKIVKVW